MAPGRAEKCACADQCGRWVSQFALPNYEAGPTGKFERFHRFAVAFGVFHELGSPISTMRFGYARAGTSRIRVRMPEAAVNKDDLAPTGKNKVRLSRQVLAVQPKAVSGAMEQGPDEHLRPRVLAFHRAHDRASRLGRESVNHYAYRSPYWDDAQRSVPRCHLAFIARNSALKGSDTLQLSKIRWSLVISYRVTANAHSDGEPDIISPKSASTDSDRAAPPAWPCNADPATSSSTGRTRRNSSSLPASRTIA